MNNYITGTLIIGGGLIAAAAGVNPVPDWHTILTDFGFPIALVCFFVWHAWKREEKITDRVNELQNFLQTKLIEIDERGILAIADNTSALNRLVEALEARPCLCGEEFIHRLAEPVQRLTLAVERLDKALARQNGKAPSE